MLVPYMKKLNNVEKEVGLLGKREGRRGVKRRTSDVLGKDNGSCQSGEAIGFVALGIRL